MRRFIVKGMGYGGREEVKSDVKRTEVLRNFPYHGEKEVRFRYNEDYVVVHCEKYPASDLDCVVNEIPRYAEKTSLDFQVLLNPSVKKHPITEVRGVSAWVAKKAVENGFSIKSFEVLSLLGAVKGTKTDKEGKIYPLIHNAAEIKGSLEVTNSDLFFKALCLGIGPGKGYGFGLIEIL